MRLIEAHHADRAAEPAVTLWFAAIVMAGTTFIGLALVARVLAGALG